MKKHKLKPCPFCGSDAKLVENYRGQVRIECTNLACRASHNGWFDDPYGDARYAVNAWNERKVKCSEKPNNSTDFIRREYLVDHIHACMENDRLMLTATKEEILQMVTDVPSADRPKSMIHIDDVYRLIAGHSNYHGDSILSAFTCLVEGKDVKPIAPLDESAEPKTGKWLAEIGYDGEVIYYECQHCGGAFTLIDGTPEENNYNYCPNCGAKMGVNK